MNEALIKKIEAAFADIPKPGIGPREAYAYDRRWSKGELHEDMVAFMAAVNGDVETDWRDIPDDVIKKAEDVLPFFEMDGFKFMMPAIMRWSLKPIHEGKSNNAPYFLINLLPESRKKPKPEEMVQALSLSQAQIDVTVEWLKDYIEKNYGEKDGWINSLGNLEAEQLERWRALASSDKGNS